MSMYLKKSFFARNKDREEAYGSLFNKASSSLLFLINVIVAGLFAPVVIATSLVSKDVALMLANIFLSAGYSANFIYRLISKEVSTSELFISAIALSVSLTLTFYFLPVTTVWSFVNIVNFCNHIATAVNGFFLIRNIIVPPLKQFSERIAHFIGLEIGGNYYYQRPLTLAKDRFVIDRLFGKHYHHDATQSKQFKEELQPFNNLLKKLVFYVNKYNEPLFGSLSSAENISSHEKLISQLTVEGNAVNCLSRIEQKLAFKKTKIALLEGAKTEVQTITDESSTAEIKDKLRFFGSIPVKEIHKNRGELRQQCLNIIDKEIQRQNAKVEELCSCLPMTSTVF